MKLKQKVSHFLKHNVFINSLFSSDQLNQTDFGRIYFNLPSETVWPETSAELARTLKRYHKRGKPVTIRNTGHSVNGQTLTSGTQINIGKIKKVHFDRKNMEVTCGAGTSWDDVFKEIGLPKFSIPVFPNNPGQKIHIGGTASVGGVGPFTSKNGGFWNHVKRLKLVTMTGETIECSPTKNPEMFKFALGGFGRIGVISELTVAVIPSVPVTVVLFLAHRSFNSYYKDLKAARELDLFDTIVGFHEVGYASMLAKVNMEMLGMIVSAQLKHEDDLEPWFARVKEHMHSDVTFFVDHKDSYPEGVEFNFKHKLFTTKDYAYYYPKYKGTNQLQLAHPWSDYIVGEANYSTFVHESGKIVQRHGMAPYMVKQTVAREFIDVDVLISYSIRNLAAERGDFFPLSLDLSVKDKYAYDVAFGPAVPQEKIADAIKMNHDLADLVFELGGKKYLYGQHNLSKRQIEKQFGRETIHQWQKIKDDLDPKHLLNIGVIEHLDD
jgi:FAD/FMN-containing dehydrogenase